MPRERRQGLRHEAPPRPPRPQRGSPRPAPPATAATRSSRSPTASARRTSSTPSTSAAIATSKHAPTAPLPTPRPASQQLPRLGPRPRGHQGRLPMAATCADCHSAHGVLPSKNPDLDRQPSQHPRTTCGKCHVGVVEKYATSVHGRSTLEANGKAAVCTDCHTAHQITHASSPDFMLDVIGECGRCHDSPDAEGDRIGTYYQTYAESYHGQVTQLGDTRAARCSIATARTTSVPSTTRVARRQGQPRRHLRQVPPRRERAVRQVRPPRQLPRRQELPDPPRRLALLHDHDVQRVHVLRRAHDPLVLPRQLGNVLASGHMPITTHEPPPRSAVSPDWTASTTLWSPSPSSA